MFFRDRVKVERWGEEEEAEEMRKGDQTGAVNTFCIKNRWEECMTTTFPLFAPPPSFLPCLSVCHPPHGIRMSYCEWRDCAWEVYLTEELKVRLVHSDAMGRTRRLPLPVPFSIVSSSPDNKCVNYNLLYSRVKLRHFVPFSMAEKIGPAVILVH